MQWHTARPARLVAGLTVAYSTAAVLAPAVLAKPCRLTDAAGEVPAELAQLIRSIGLRDATLAAAWGLAPAGYPMSLLTGARVVSDAADAAWLGRIVPAGQRGKIVGAALGWALLEAVVGALAHRQAAPQRLRHRLHTAGRG